jgi:hypothetical protein
MFSLNDVRNIYNHYSQIRSYIHIMLQYYFVKFFQILSYKKYVGI